MSRVIIVGTVLLLAGGGLYIYRQPAQGGSMKTSDDVLQYLSTQLAPLPAAQFVPGDCSLIFSSDMQTFTACLMSPVAPDELVEVLRTKADTLGVSVTGWTQNYSVWGAFYALKTAPKWTFGLNIKGIENSLDFEGVTAANGFKSFVAIVVNSEPAP